jgi:Ca2+-binding RTX toxin-like protein
MGTIIGTNANDRFEGTADADHIVGADGNDFLYGMDGDDLVEGGNHDDYLSGGNGNDVLRGGDGNDHLVDDSYLYAVSRDEMYGEAGNDVLSIDRRVTTSATLIVDGGTGNDRLSYSAWYAVDHVTLRGGDGDDIIDTGSAATMIIDAGAGADRLTLGLFGYAGTTMTVTLGAGSDYVDLVRGSARSSWPTVPLRFTDFEGGPAGDRILLDNYLAILLNWDQASNPFATGHLSLVNRDGVGAVLRMDQSGGGDEYRDLIVFEGTDAATLGVWNIGWHAGGVQGTGRLFLGDGAANRIDGTAEGDLIRGFEGSDTIRGNAGSDLIEAGDGNDDVESGWGDDRLYGEGGHDVLADLYGGNDSLYGGEGNDRLIAQRSSFAAPSTVLLDGGNGDDTLRVEPFNEVPYREFLDDITVLGGEGNDYIYVYSARTAVIDAGSGADTVLINQLQTAFTITLGAGVDTLELSGSRGPGGGVVVTDMETGDAGDRLIIDNFLRAQLKGWDPTTNPFDQGFVRIAQRGADAVLEIDRDGPAGAGAFADLIVFRNADAASFTSRNLGGYVMLTGTEAGETIEGTPGNDVIRGLGGDDTLIGHDGHDTLEGGAGNDILWGTYGKDRLDGGIGADRMEGGEGDDVYIVDDAGDVVVESVPPWLPDHSADEVRTALSVYTIAAGVEKLTGTSAAGQILYGDARQNSIYGSTGDDFIYTMGTADGTADLALGGAGNDRLEGSDSMDVLYGGPGSDILLGHGGDDSLAVSYFGVDAPAEVNRAEGGAGNDRIEGGFGHDTLLGGAGNDDIRDGSGGDDLLDGGDGNDNLSTGTSYNGPRRVDVLGGAGDDTAYLGTPSGGTMIVDLGSGDDFVNLNQVWGTTTITLGAGRDTLSLSPYQYVYLSNVVTVTDFTGGAEGDRLTIDGWLGQNVTGWDKVSNPFATGHLRLIQGAAGAELQIDYDGGGDTFVARFVFSGTDAAAFTAANFQAFAPPAVHGTAGGDTIRGSAGNDRVESGAGRDMLRLEQGGDDQAYGGGDVDSFYFGGAFTAADKVDGGEDRDALILQGHYALTLGTGSIAGIESISLLSGLNAGFGDAAGNPYSYDLTLADGNVAAGALMKINGSNLLAGENFTLNASAETDAPLQVFAGFGTDTFTGGQQGDAFIFGHDGRLGAGDRVDGGGGYDVVYLRGDYTLDFNAAGFETAFTNVESLAILTSANSEFAGGGDGDFDYTITWADGLLAAGATFTVNASRLQAHETFTFDGSREMDGVLRVFGGASADTLTGGGWSTQLHGGGGADVLNAGTGADIFRYSNVAESNAGTRDVIHGFAAGIDRIDVNRVDAKTSTADLNEAFIFIGANAFAAAGPNEPGQLRTYNVSGNLWRVEGDVNGDGVADLVIDVHVEAGQPLTAADFIV